MNALPLPDPFLPALAAVQRVLETFSHRGVIIGGIAASLLGEPRTTADWERIRYWLQQFADVMERPEIWTDIAYLVPKTSLLKPRPKPKRKK